MKEDEPTAPQSESPKMLRVRLRCYCFKGGHDERKLNLNVRIMNNKQRDGTGKHVGSVFSAFPSIFSVFDTFLCGSFESVKRGWILVSFHFCVCFFYFVCRICRAVTFLL